MRSPFRQEYEDSILRWLKAHKDHPELNHGPEPSPKTFGFETDTDLWEARQIKERAKKELNRHA